MSNEEPTNRRPAHRAKTSDGGLSGSILKKSSTGSTAARNDSDGGNGICWNYNVKSFKACEGDTHVEAEDFHVSVLDADFKPEEAGLDQSGTIEYYPMDESTNSRRLSAKWDDLIFKKRMMKGRKQKGCFAEEKNSPIEEEGSPSNENDNPPKDIARRYSSFDSFGLSVDGSDRDENQHDQALTSRMRRALQAFASFGAESAIPEEEEVVPGIDNDAIIPKKKTTTKKGKRGSVSIMNMVISFKKQSKTTKKESGEEETPRAEPPKARRGSIARVVESIKKGKSSAKKKEPTRPIETNNTARAADTTSDQAKAGSSSQQRAKKRNSLVKLANAIKFRPTSPSDNSNGTEMTATLDRSDKSKQAGAVAGQEPRPKATRPRRTNRRATTDASLRTSAKKFNQLAATTTGGSGRQRLTLNNGHHCRSTEESLRTSAKKFNDLAEVHASINSTARTSSLSTNSASRESLNSSAGIKINIGGEERFNDTISSILYMNPDPSRRGSVERRATQ